MSSREIAFLVPLAFLFVLVSLPLKNAVIDDTFIHLQYARNLAEDGQLAFNKGEPSYGATSPLWVGILAAVRKAGLDMLRWCHILSWFFAILSVFLLYYYVKSVGGGIAAAAAAAAILSVEAWFVRWSAVGMETSFAVFMVLLVLVFSVKAMRSVLNSVIFGAVLTLAVLSRPEAVLLVPASAVVFLFLRRERPYVSTAWLMVFIIGYGAWLLLVKAHAGTYFPLTAGAKRGWMILSSDILKRALIPLKIIGATLFIPSVLFLVYLAYGLVRHKDLLKDDLVKGELLLPLLWVVGLPAVYLIFDFNILSRYLLPLAPAIITIGAVSLERVLSLRGYGRTARRVLISVFAVIVAAQNLVFYTQVVVPPTRNFSRGVKEVLTGMGKWLKANTDSQAVIAAPDIGAIGYYSERKILDLGGLITPEINRMRNSMELESILLEGHFLKFSPDYFLDRDPIAERFSSMHKLGVGFVPVMSDTVWDLGIRKPGSVVYTLYRLDREENQLKTPPASD